MNENSNDTHDSIPDQKPPGRQRASQGTSDELSSSEAAGGACPQQANESQESSGIQGSRNETQGSLEPVLDPRMLEGIDLFNRREFFECHEILEDLWNDQSEPEKQLTQGIIQIAVAYYHALRENRVGALKLLKRGIPRVKPFMPEFRKLQLLPFIDSVEQDMERIEAGVPGSELRLPTIEFLA